MNETTALTIIELARLMDRQTGAAFDDDLRCTSDTDEVMLGRLTMLDVIADALWLDGKPVPQGEMSELGAAKNRLGAACDFLTTRITRASQPTEFVIERGLAESAKVPL